MTDLASCPFCGGEARVYEDQSSDYRQHWDWRVGCIPCDFDFIRATKADAIDVWNRRATPPIPKDAAGLVEGLEQAASIFDSIQASEANHEHADCEPHWSSQMDAEAGARACRDAIAALSRSNAAAAPVAEPRAAEAVGVTVETDNDPTLIAAVKKIAYYDGAFPLSTMRGIAVDALAALHAAPNPVAGASEVERLRDALERIRNYNGAFPNSTIRGIAAEALAPTATPPNDRDDKL